MKYWKRFNLCLCCGLLIWFVLPVIPEASAKTVDRIVAKVNEKIITQSELEERTIVKMMSLQKMNANPMPSREEIIHDELEHMIEERLLIDAGRKLGLKVEEENVTKAIDEIKRTNGLSEGDLEKMLKAESKSIEEYRDKIRNQILISRVIGFEVRKRVTVGNEEIEEYYNQHLKDYWTPEKLQLRHILFLMDDKVLDEDKRIKKQKARQALREIRSGVDFITVAKKFSEDISASTGGDLGEIERGKMVPEFEKAAFLLKEGEVSGLVETPYGLHIIKVDKILPGQTLPLEKVKDSIESQFKDKKLKAEYEKYLSELKQKAFIENKMSPVPQPAVGNAKKTMSAKTLKPSRNREEVLVDIPSRRKKLDSSQQLTQKQEFGRFQTFEEKLRYYKQLRKKNKISEGEYQNKKRELLNQF